MYDGGPSNPCSSPYLPLDETNIGSMCGIAPKCVSCTWGIVDVLWSGGMLCDSRWMRQHDKVGLSLLHPLASYV